MNTNLNNKDEIRKAFNDLLTFADEHEEVEHEAAMIMFQFLSEIAKVMEDKKISKKNLAEIIGTSPSYITQLFRGDKLVNFKTLAKIQKGLDMKFEVKIKKKQEALTDTKDIAYDDIFDQKPKGKISDLIASIMKDNSAENVPSYWQETSPETSESSALLAA